MRRVLVFLWICLLLSACTRAAGEITLPFALEDVRAVELFHYTVPAQAEKKTVIAQDAVKDLYEGFEGLKTGAMKVEDQMGTAVYSFRFLLQDGTHFDLVYTSLGVKKGNLYIPSTGAYCFTAADLGWYWDQLDPTLAPVPAAESELPAYGNLPQVEPALVPVVEEGKA